MGTIIGMGVSLLTYLIVNAKISNVRNLINQAEKIVKERGVIVEPPVDIDEFLGKVFNHEE